VNPDTSADASQNSKRGRLGIERLASMW
jgi:hypothetical protein